MNIMQNLVRSQGTSVRNIIERHERQKRRASHPGIEISPFVGHSDSINAVQFSPDGKVVVTGSDDKTVRVWNARTGEAIHALEGHTAAVTSVSISPEGRIIASGSSDKTIRLWDMAGR